MAIDSTAAPYVPKTFYGPDGQLSIPGDTTTASAEATAGAVGAGIRDFVATLPPADRAAFMSAVNATGPATFAPGGKVAPDLEARLTQIEASEKSFASMLVSTNDFDALARAMIEQYGQQRHEAVVDRQQMRQMAQVELLASAGELDTKANDMMAGAITSLVLSVVSAAVEVGMSFASLKGIKEGAEADIKAAGQLGSVEGELAAREEGTVAGSATKRVGEGEPALDAAPLEAPAWKNGIVPGREAPKAPPEPDLAASETQPKGSPSKGEKAAENDLSSKTTKELHEMKADAKIAAKQAEIKTAEAQFLGQVGGSVGHLGQSLAGAANTIAQSQATKAEAEGKRDEAAAENLNAQADLKKALVDGLDDMIKQLIAAVKDLQEAKAERMRTFSRI